MEHNPDLFCRRVNCSGTIIAGLERDGDRVLSHSGKLSKRELKTKAPLNVSAVPFCFMNALRFYRLKPSALPPQFFDEPSKVYWM
jgi:hypothetical protein